MEELLATFGPLVIMILIFYFLLYRPQKKRQQEHQAFIASIKRGMRVVTNSGIIGNVAAVKDHTILLEVSDGVNIEVATNMVVGEYSLENLEKSEQA